MIIVYQVSYFKGPIPQGMTFPVTGSLCETFGVENLGSGRYLVTNPTAFLGGGKVVKTLEAVRRLIERHN